jgi:transcriptional regulator with GAF, ATPase, and Fis domain
LDLYHRVSVVSVLLPPLKDRTSDIPALVRQEVITAAFEADFLAALSIDCIENKLLV